MTASPLSRFIRFAKPVLCGVSLCILASSIAVAQGVEVKKDSADYPVLAKLRGDDKTLAYDYLGQQYGMDAWLLSGPELMQVVFVLPGSKAAIIGGTLVDENGKEASSTLMRSFLEENAERANDILARVRHVKDDPKETDTAAPDHDMIVDAASPSQKFWNSLAHVGTITFGTNMNAPLIYAVLDPAQPESVGVWKALQPLAEKGHLRVAVVPLALTMADSILDVARILGDENPQQAWTDLMDGKVVTTETTPESHGVLKMKATVDLAQSLNLRQLPLLIYKAVGTDTVRLVRGVPKNWIAVFREAGMAETQEVDNVKN